MINVSSNISNRSSKHRRMELAIIAAGKLWQGRAQEVTIEDEHGTGLRYQVEASDDGVFVRIDTVNFRHAFKAQLITAYRNQLQRWAAAANLPFAYDFDLAGEWQYYGPAVEAAPVPAVIPQAGAVIEVLVGAQRGELMPVVRSTTWGDIDVQISPSTRWTYAPSEYRIAVPHAPGF